MMNCPSFNIPRFGHFKCVRMTSESREARSAIVAANYEFEFYYQDFPGGLTINDVRHPVCAGGFTCCKPGQQRKMDLPYHCYFFNIATKDPSLIALLNRMPDFGILQNWEKIISLCNEMNAVISATEVEGQLQITGYILQILGLIAQQLHLLPGMPSQGTLLHQRELVAANEYLREHLTEDLDLAKLAKAANLHPTYFHKLFTTAYNSTPQQQLYFHRSVAAQGLLKHSDLTLAEIAEECGFASQSFVSSKFKEMTGQTPTKFRQSARKTTTKK